MDRGKSDAAPPACWLLQIERLRCWLPDCAAALPQMRCLQHWPDRLPCLHRLEAVRV